MNLTLSQNMIFYVLTIVVFGKTIKPLIKKHRKTVLPLLLLGFGVGLSLGVNFLNGNLLIGDALLQGIISSIVAQYSFDKVKEMLKDGVNNEKIDSKDKK